MLVEWSGTFETGFVEGRQTGAEGQRVHRSLDSARFRSKWVPSVYLSYVMDGASENLLSWRSGRFFQTPGRTHGKMGYTHRIIGRGIRELLVAGRRSSNDRGEE